ncbi:sulfotransferase [Pseudoroseicyclus sp. CXY001]|uniref:tetratricopeptide repeat-containing sulfotransferase family protein n=1 Tax=Pseudoroseicyclus sp. CXY001 TaxID=3242492 RepID=UPI0035713D92
MALRPAAAPIGQRITAAIRAGRGREAAGLIEAALRQRPKDAALLLTLAQVHNRLTREPGAARAAAEKAVKAAPSSARARLEAAEAAALLQDFPAAEAHLSRARALAPKEADVHYVAAALAERMGQSEAALAAAEEALRLAPGHLPARLQIATSLRNAGRLEEAAAACHALFTDAPDNSHLYGIWARTGRIAEDDPLYLHLRDSLVPRLRKAGGPALSAPLAALAKARDDQGAHEEALALHAEAKAAEGLTYDAAAYEAFVDALTAAPPGAPVGPEGPAPVLITGLPRSGSTLLEQMLARHPALSAAGESEALALMVKGEGVALRDGPALAALTSGLGHGQAARLAKGYQAIVARSAGEGRAIDKRLHNFELIGLFSRLFPEGRVLAMRRDPLDMLTSCYLQPLGPFHSYTRSLEGLAAHYLAHRRLMAHWQAALPGRIHEVSYEALVTGPEPVLREVLGFLGLDWEPACLDHRSGGSVQTLSTWQVRQPLGPGAIGRWRRYGARLEPLKAALAEVYPEGFGAPAV